jgi:hypothetical protein
MVQDIHIANLKGHVHKEGFFFGVGVECDELVVLKPKNGISCQKI